MAVKKYRPNENKPCVYRYTDLEDNVIKYVGIVHSGTLAGRIYNHAAEEWCRGKVWRIEYIECETRAEVEAFEAHLIALYKTYRYYNKCKASWGINHFLPDIENLWTPVHTCIFADLEAYKTAKAIRQSIKVGKYEIARILLDCLEFTR